MSFCIHYLWSFEVDVTTAWRVAGNIYAERSNTGAMDGFNVRSVDILDVILIVHASWHRY